jgi:hypothetical protein
MKNPLAIIKEFEIDLAPLPAHRFRHFSMKTVFVATLSTIVNQVNQSWWRWKRDSLPKPTGRAPAGSSSPSGFAEKTEGRDRF